MFKKVKKGKKTMKKIKKLVAIQPVSFLEESKPLLNDYCDEVVFYDTQPESAEEIVSRIGDADAIFVSYTHAIGGDILSECPNLKYIGMCCSLYSEASSNVDIAYAREHGIVVTGIRDYGDEGVAEYVLMNSIRRLHGADGYQPLLGDISEVSGAKVGLLGLGASAQAVARVLKMMGAGVRYYSRTRKPELEEAQGYQYQELHSLLQECDIICSCLSKNVKLLYEEEFALMGENKILFNTALSPCFDQKAIEKWLDKDNTWYFCDTLMGLGEERLLNRENVFCQKRSSGMTRQAVVRLNQKVLENLKNYIED